MLNSFSRKSPRSDSQYPEYIPSGRGGGPSLQALGGMLRERREAMGVTLAEVEVATRIRQKYLAALEADEWHLLPGEVVGRGFLRNYADYLGLEPNEVMERRRAVTDNNLSAALSTTSAGAPLPPEREVDYRPKEVELKDETDVIEQGEIRLTPIFAILALAVLVGLGWWGLNAFSEPITAFLTGSQTRVAGLFDRSPAEAEQIASAGSDLGVVNEQNTAEADATATSAAAAAVLTDTLPAVVTPGTVILGGAPPAEAPAAEQIAEGALPAAEQGAEQPASGQPAEPPALVPTSTPEAAAALTLTQELPTATLPAATPEVPTPEAPTATPEAPTPEPPTPTPEALPTETPTPEPPPPAAAPAACADGRSMISAPGAGQIVGGIVGVTGTAQHESFQYYKLEYAPGAWAAGGFVYFDGSNSQVAGGLLGNLDTGVLPNGDYTIRLTVVDQTGNFPAPCDVALVVQN